jgi:hypothetical protein
LAIWRIRDQKQLEKAKAKNEQLRKKKSNERVCINCFCQKHLRFFSRPDRKGEFQERVVCHVCAEACKRSVQATFAKWDDIRDDEVLEDFDKTQGCTGYNKGHDSRCPCPIRRELKKELEMIENKVKALNKIKDKTDPRATALVHEIRQSKRNFRFKFDYDHRKTKREDPDYRQVSRIYNHARRALERLKCDLKCAFCHQAKTILCSDDRSAELEEGESMGLLAQNERKEKAKEKSQRYFSKDSFGCQGPNAEGAPCTYQRFFDEVMSKGGKFPFERVPGLCFKKMFSIWSWFHWDEGEGDARRSKLRASGVPPGGMRKQQRAPLIHQWTLRCKIDDRLKAMACGDTISWEHDFEAFIKAAEEGRLPFGDEVE